MPLDVNRMLDTLRERQLVPDTCQAAFVVGSFARGWSNQRSDYDIYLVSTDPWPVPESVGVGVPLQPAEVQWHSFHADGHGWDLAYWLDGQIDQMLAKISWDAYDQVRATSGDTLATREESFIERVTTCVPLLGEEWVRRRRAEIDSSTFRSLMVARSLGCLEMSVEDALGQLENGDVHSAVISARNALGYTVDALLEEQGEYGSHSPKWRPRRFREVSLATLTFEKYWELETMRNFDPDNPAQWINEVLTLCQDLSLKVSA